MWARMEVGKLGAAAFWAYWQRRRGQGVEDVSRSPHPCVVARADPHPSTTHSPPDIRFYPLRTKRARTCVRAYVRACVRACTRAHACLPGLVLKGSMYGEDVRAHSARGPTIVWVVCVRSRVEQVYALFLSFFFFYRRSVSLFFSISFPLSFSFRLCVSIFFCVEKPTHKGHLRATGRSPCARSVRGVCDKYPTPKCRLTLDSDR